jgi:hypothetical protein
MIVPPRSLTIARHDQQDQEPQPQLRLFGGRQ